MKGQILNLGCGNDYLEGATNIDYFSSRVDVRHELNTFPYPFDDGQFDEIRCLNIIEHLDDVIKVMEELHRIARPDCILVIRVPHFRSACLYEDVTHKHGFAWRSFDIFVDESAIYGEYSNAKFTYMSRAYTSYKIPWLYRLLSRFPVLTDNVISKFVPMASIIVTLRIVK